MYITRDIEVSIKNSIENYSKPICLLGARQVGKSTTVKHCLQDYDYVYVNMFDTYGINTVFNENMDISVQRIVHSLELLVERKITNDTIIVLDEIQSNPSALASLKSFNEDGRYKIIALGSNFGSFLMQKSRYSFPVGQIYKLNMYPISFTEYLSATSNDFLLESFKDSIKAGKINEVLHDKLLMHFDKYISIGGMPEVVSTYISSEGVDDIEHIKGELVDGYLADFGKFEYAIDNTKALNIIYKSIPKFLNKDNQKFIFSEINYEFKQLKKSFKWLHDNNYVILVPQINSISLPLSGNEKESSFKLFGNETSLVLKQANYEPLKIIKEQDKVYYGFVMENYIATVMDKYQKIYTYRNRQTEIDFIYEMNSQVYAIEVKSGNNKRSKSLRILKERNEDVIAIKTSRANLYYGEVNSIPLYAIDYMLKHNLLNDLN